MTQFALFATLLVVVTALLIIPGLWFGRRRPSDADRKAANLAIFRDQLADLERERLEGNLGEPDFAQAKVELQKRLLEEVGETQESDGGPANSRKTALLVLFLLPLAAVGGYLMLGNPQALDPVATAPQKQMTAADIDAMVAKLAARMQENPSDMNGWLMLARSYKMLGRYGEAVDAYAKAEPAIEKDPELLASYAETLAMANGKGLTGKAKELIDQALKLDPKHAHTLFLAGAAAMEAGDRKNGIAYWEALLPQVEAGSELDQMLRKGIEEMKKGG